ncbi:MAG: glycosyltransferase family 4 protein [Desulfuromonadales bacterium]
MIIRRQIIKQNAKSRKVKIIIFESGFAGGSVKSLMKILANWDFLKYPAGLFSFSNKMKAGELLRNSSVEFVDSFHTEGGLPPDSIVKKFGILIPTVFGIRYFLKSLVLLFRHKFACIYINNTPYSHTPLIIAAALLRRKIICHLRDTIEFTRIEQRQLSYITSFIALGDSARFYYINQGIAADRITTIYNSIDTSPYVFSANRLQKDRVSIVVVGSLTYRKGQDVCLKALAKVLKYHSNVTMTFIGEGETRAELEKVVIYNKLQENVVFIGHTEKVLEVLQESDIGLLASRREGMPNSVMEYMAAGLPVVVTDLPGIRELVDDEETGFIVPQESDEELANRLIQLIGDADLRAEMGHKGIEKINSERFLPSTEKENILKLFLETDMNSKY